MQQAKAFFCDQLGIGSTAPKSKYEGKVPIHNLTQKPTQAWDKMKVKQVKGILSNSAQFIFF